MMEWFVLPLLGSLLWFAAGRIILACAQVQVMQCCREWDNTVAVLLWPFFGACVVAEMLADATARRRRLRELEDARVAAALREFQE